jgi:hypothetical protein
VKRLVRPRLGFGGCDTARRPLAGYEAMAMVRKGRVRSIGGRDMRAQASFVAELFQVAAWFVPGRTPPIKRHPELDPRRHRELDPGGHSASAWPGDAPAFCSSPERRFSRRR